MENTGPSPVPMQWDLPGRYCSVHRDRGRGDGKNFGMAPSAKHGGLTMGLTNEFGSHVGLIAKLHSNCL